VIQTEVARFAARINGQDACWPRSSGPDWRKTAVPQVKVAAMARKVSSPSRFYSKATLYLLLKIVSD